MDGVISNSRDMIRLGSKSFATAARLFSPPARHSAYMLYAWCRYCDDQIDGQDLGMGMQAIDPVEQRQRLAALRRQTDSALAGEPQSDPVFDGLRRVVHTHRIPAHFPRELLEGFRMDVDGHRYHALDDTLLYCYRVAGVVGVMMACVMGVREQSDLQRAADLGIAFQLTNIARDVLDDAAAGRCYLPANWLAGAGIDVSNHAARHHRKQLSGVVRQLLEEAERYYDSARQGLRALPFRSAWAVATALGVYREIGQVVLARGSSAGNGRATVGKARKIWHVFKSTGTAGHARLASRLGPAQPRDPQLWTYAASRSKTASL